MERQWDGYTMVKVTGKNNSFYNKLLWKFLSSWVHLFCLIILIINKNYLKKNTHNLLPAKNAFLEFVNENLDFFFEMQKNCNKKLFFNILIVLF